MAKDPKKPRKKPAPRQDRSFRCTYGRGRPPGGELLTPAAMKQMCKWLRLGAPPDSAAASVGATKQSYRKWLRIGVRSQAKESPSEFELRCQEFAKMVTVAVAEAEVNAVELIHTAGKAGDWRALAFLLTHKPGARWHKPQELKVKAETSNVNVNIEAKSQIDWSKVSVAERLQLLDILDKAKQDPIIIPADQIKVEDAKGDGHG